MERFDTLVIGGGTAGCVLAARLSEESDRKVCLVEAGPDYGPYGKGGWPDEILDARSVPETHDWGFAGDVSLLRARIVGGCSAHNACFVVWGASEDYDEWERAGNPGWSFAAVEPYLRRAEAELLTRVPAEEELSPWHRAVRAAAEAVGLPVLDDFNASASTQGVAPIPLNAVGNVRWSTALAYFEPTRERSNLTVVADTVADRVLLDGRRAVGVAVRRDGMEADLAAGTVILTAGAYESPAILMRSGIGAEAHLREHSIAVARALPGVGANLIDHSGASLFFQPGERLQAELATQDQRGLLFEGQCAVKAGSSRCPEGLWDLHLLPWASPNDERIVKGDYETHVTVFVMKPRSRGRVRLRSADPEVLPAVEQRFFSDDEGDDVAVLVDGLELVRRLATTPPIAELVDGEAIPGEGVRDRDQLTAWAHEAARGYFHPVGTCAMGPADDPNAVVDPSGRVHGFTNLYVADASIMPTIPRANTNLTTVAIAERIARLIRSSRPRVRPPERRRDGSRQSPR